MTSDRHETIKSAVTDSVHRYVVDVQADDWTRLKDAIDRAINQTWSIDCGWIGSRIIRAARLVGPTPWEQVPWPLVSGHVYAALLFAGGVAAEVPKGGEETKTNNLMRGHGLVGWQAADRYKFTVKAIKADSAYLSEPSH